jgi:hypothetical protein
MAWNNLNDNYFMVHVNSTRQQHLQQQCVAGLACWRRCNMRDCISESRASAGRHPNTHQRHRSPRNPGLRLRNRNGHTRHQLDRQQPHLCRLCGCHQRPWSPAWTYTVANIQAGTAPDRQRQAAVYRRLVAGGVYGSRQRAAEYYGVGRLWPHQPNTRAKP